MWGTDGPRQIGTVSDSGLALRFLAFKENTPGPPPSRLLNKQDRLSPDRNQCSKMKSSPGKGYCYAACCPFV